MSMRLCQILFSYWSRLERGGFFYPKTRRSPQILPADEIPRRKPLMVRLQTCRLSYRGG